MIDTTPKAFSALASRLRKAEMGIATFASEEAITKANSKRGDAEKLVVKKLI